MQLNSTEPKNHGKKLTVRQKNGYIMVHCHNEKLYSNTNEATLHVTKQNLTEEEAQKKHSVNDCILETSKQISSVRSQDCWKLWRVEGIDSGLKTGAFKVLIMFCFLT